MSHVVRACPSAGLVFAAGLGMFGLAFPAIEPGPRGANIASLWVANAAAIALLAAAVREEEAVADESVFCFFLLCSSMGS